MSGGVIFYEHEFNNLIKAIDQGKIDDNIKQMIKSKKQDFKDTSAITCVSRDDVKYKLMNKYDVCDEKSKGAKVIENAIKDIDLDDLASTICNSILDMGYWEALDCWVSENVTMPECIRCGEYHEKLKVLDEEFKDEFYCPECYNHLKEDE